MSDASPGPDTPAERRERLAAVERENRRLHRELEQLRSSTSFRLGHLLVRTATRLVPRRGSAGSGPPDPSAPTGTSSARSEGSVPARPQPADPARSQGDGPVASDAGNGTSGARRRADSLLPGLGPDAAQAVLVDATEVDTATAEAVAHRLLTAGHHPTLVHPCALELEGVRTHVAEEMPDGLAARFGPAQTVRVVSGGDVPPSLLAREPRPLQLVVDEAGSPDGLPPGPVFVGGTGRSGTWVLGRMLAAHPRVVTVHTELRFHCSAPGYAGVLAGRVSPQEYAELVHRKWFRPTSGRNAKGLQLISGNRELRATLAAFVERAEDDVPGALGQLMLDLVGPYARGRGALRWVETSPDNASAAAALTTVLPDARVIHSVRDGRDVAASVVTMSWGPDSHLEALAWWAKRLRDAHAGMSRADAGKVHTVRLEELLDLDRERAIDELLGFLRFTDDEAVRTYFREEMDGGRGNVGRWRGELDVDQRDAFEGRYRELLAELEDEGVTGLPAAPEAVDQLARD